MQENWDALKSENPEFEHYLYDDPAFKPLVVVGRSPNTAELQLVIPLFARTVGDEVVAEYASAGVTDYACAIVSNDLLRDPGQLSGFPGLRFSSQIWAPASVISGPKAGNFKLLALLHNGFAGGK